MNWSFYYAFRTSTVWWSILKQQFLILLDRRSLSEFFIIIWFYFNDNVDFQAIILSMTELANYKLFENLIEYVKHLLLINKNSNLEKIIRQAESKKEFKWGLVEINPWKKKKSKIKTFSQTFIFYIFLKKPFDHQKQFHDFLFDSFW